MMIKNRLTRALLPLPALLCLNGLLCLPPGASAQLPDRRHFLWYTGHWSPAKKNVFIIEKDSGIRSTRGISPRDGTGDGDGTGPATPAGSGTITVDPDGTIHTAGGGQDEWNKKIDAGVKEIDQWVQQLGDPANNIDPRSKHLNDLLLPDAQEQQQIWNDYKIDPQQNLLEPDTRPGSAAPAKTMARTAEDFCKTSRANYDLVMGYYKTHAKDKDANMNIPPPPEFEYNCYACDSNIRKVYDTTIAHYVRDFRHPEDSMLRKGLEILHGLSQLGWNDRGVVSEELGSAIDKGGGCNNFSYTDLSEAVLGIATHVYHRVANLVIKYLRDFRAAEAVSRTYLSVARDYILLSGNDRVEDDYMQELAGTYSKSFDFYLTKLTQNDWRQIGNIPYLLSLAREVSLMGGDVGDYNFKRYASELQAIMNGFVLSVDMDVKIGRGQGYWWSHLKGECHIGPDFDLGDNQCYKWVVVDENRKDVIGCYIARALQQFDCDVMTNEMTGPGPNPEYIGTKKYSVNLEGLKMDFCNPGKDTIALSNFSPDPASNGYWQFPHSMKQNIGITGAQFFQDENARKQLAESGKAQAAADKFQADNEQTIAQMKALQEKMQSDTGKKTLADYQQIMQMVNKIQASSVATVMAEMMWVDFELPVQNGGQILVDKKFDAKEINPQMAHALEHAYYTIHIENKGNPSKKTNAPPKK